MWHFRHEACFKTVLTKPMLLSSTLKSLLSLVVCTIDSHQFVDDQDNNTQFKLMSLQSNVLSISDLRCNSHYFDDNKSDSLYSASGEV